MKYRVKVGEYNAWFDNLWEAMRWFFYNADFAVTDDPPMDQATVKFYRGRKLVCYSGWNKEKYRKDGWYGAEFVLCRGVEPKIYKTISDYLKWNIYGNAMARGRYALTPFNPAKDWHEHVVKREGFKSDN